MNPNWKPGAPSIRLLGPELAEHEGPSPGNVPLSGNSALRLFCWWSFGRPASQWAVAPRLLSNGHAGTCEALESPRSICFENRARNVKAWLVYRTRNSGVRMPAPTEPSVLLLFFADRRVGSNEAPARPISRPLQSLNPQNCSGAVGCPPGPVIELRSARRPRRRQRPMEGKQSSPDGPPQCLRVVRQVGAPGPGTDALTRPDRGCPRRPGLPQVIAGEGGSGWCPPPCCRRVVSDPLAAHFALPAKPFLTGGRLEVHRSSHASNSARTLARWPRSPVAFKTRRRPRVPSHRWTSTSYSPGVRDNFPGLCPAWLGGQRPARQCDGWVVERRPPRARPCQQSDPVDDHCTATFRYAAHPQKPRARQAARTPGCAPATPHFVGVCVSSTPPYVVNRGRGCPWRPLLGPLFFCDPQQVARGPAARGNPVGLPGPSRTPGWPLTRAGCRLRHWTLGFPCG